jgi:hypothetical protein
MKTISRQQQGSAMTEMAIVLPLLVMLMLALFDGIVVAKEYFTMTEMAREGILTASNIANLPNSTLISNSPLNASDLTSCFDSTFSHYQPSSGNEALCAERTIRWRLMKLGVSYGKEMNIGEFQIRVIRDLARRSVKLEIERVINGVSPFFKQAHIRSQAEGPYDL